VKIETKFDIQDHVIINGDRNGIVAVIQRIFLNGGGGILYEVSWFDSSGSFREHSMYEWQLTRENTP
jgi:hypothetical protein